MEENPEQCVENEEVSDEEVLTAQTALQEIEDGWINEKFAPEILPHKSDLVDCMLQQIAHMEENMKRLNKNDLRLVIHRMELDRIRFVISSYLRTRLEKIERYTVHILSEDAQRVERGEESYLTPGELKFAKEYLGSIETLFRTMALQHMPANFQDFEVDRLSVRPNMRSHVFLRAKREVRGIIVPGTVDEDTDVDFEAGSQHIIQYKLVADMVKTGAVQLI